LNIIILSTYPETNAVNGGQARIAQIKRFYQNQGCKAEIIGISASLDYPLNKNFVPTPSHEKFTKLYKDTESIQDFIVGELSLSDSSIRQQLIKKITYTPNIIQVEHPWLFKFAQYIKDNLYKDAKLVYSSHNIESKLKASLLKHNPRRMILNKINQIELNAIKNADYVITVSKDNKNYADQYSKKNTLIAPNGASLNDTKENLSSSISSFRYCLFFGSKYQPNIDGFFEMFDGVFGSLPPDQKLLIAGDVSYAIATDKRYVSNPNLANRSVIMGRLPRAQLSSLIKFAHCIVIPIKEGDGTSLKTAEALLSGNYILTTTIGIRGFEVYSHEKNGVFIADNSIVFKKNLQRIMQLKPLALSSHDQGQRGKILWDNCLLPLKKILQ